MRQSLRVSLRLCAGAFSFRYLNMITGRILDLVIGALIFASLTESLPARLKDRNLLYSEPGVVAVYIRPGDTPLQDINPDLAEAFNFNDVKYGRRAFGRDINKILNEKKANSVLFSSGELAEGESYAPKRKSLKERGESHIQKIPKH